MFESRKVKSLRRIGTYTWKKKKNILVILLMTFSFLTFSSLSISIGSETEDTNPVHLSTKLSVSISTSNSIYHAPINITDNTGLATMSVSGNGSSTNPYIIENLIINNCAASESGVNIRNTDKYFVLRNITVSNCSIGFFFSHVTYGSITGSSAINNTGSGFELEFSSYNVLTNNTAFAGRIYSAGFYLVFSASNNILINNTANYNWVGFIISGHPYIYGTSGYSSNNTLIDNVAMDNAETGFGIYHDDYNITLINNIAMNNGFFGFDIRSNNTILLNNKAINNQIFGFFLESSANNVLKNNIGIYNSEADYFGPSSGNDILINNTFIFINNEIASSLTLPLLNTMNIIAVAILVGIYSTIGYVHYDSKKKKKMTEQPRITQTLTKYSLENVVVLGVILGVIDVFFVILGIFFYPFVTVTLVISVTNYNSINTNIFQLAPLCGFLLLGGGITTIGGILIYIRAKSFHGYKLAEHISLIGFSTQTIGAILALLAYNNIFTAINDATNAIKSINGSPYYIISLNSSLFLSFLGVLLGILLPLSIYYYQRKANKEFFQSIGEHPI